MAARRIAVIGNIASGKSTLARAMATARKLPYRELDRFQFSESWAVAPRREFVAFHATLIADPAWVIDGIGVWGAVKDRLAAADLIVHIDHPVWLNFLWAAKRGDGAAERPEDTVRLPALEIIYPFIWDYHRRIRPRVLRQLEALKGSKPIEELRGPEALTAFAAREAAATGERGG